MPIHSRFSIDIPQMSLPTWLFGSSRPEDKELPLFLSDSNPDTMYMTFSAYKVWSQRFAAGLRAAGLELGDRVLVFSPNNIFYPVAIMGIIMAGGVFTGANPAYLSKELAHQLQDSEPTFILISAAGIETVFQAIAAVENPSRSFTNRVFLFDHYGLLDESICVPPDLKGRGVRHWGELIVSEEIGEEYIWDDLDGDQEWELTATLNYSSGTTGLPKGVEVSHKNLIAFACQDIHLNSQDPTDADKQATKQWLGFLPMYHAMGQSLFAILAPSQRIPVFVMEKFDFISMLRHIQRFRIHHLVLVPPVLVLLSQHPAVEEYDLSSIESIHSGAAPLSETICAQVQARWPAGKLRIQQGWGMTECTCGVLSWHPLETPLRGSVGELLANCEGMIISTSNEDGTTFTEAERGQKGEVWVRGPTITKGYWRNVEATKQTITTDGWLRTGDIGFVDNNGMWFIVDRIKDLIKVRGFQVAPAELEGYLLDHPGVADAAVVGVTINDEEAPRAYVKLTSSIIATPEEILTTVNSNLSHFKRITGGLVVVDEIPKSPAGKILRKRLSMQAAKEPSRTLVVSKL